MSEVPRIHTPASIPEWADAVAWAWRQLLPADPTLDALAVLWAQYALETGRGKSCFNNNLGNIRHVDGDGRDHMMLDTFEYIGGKRVDMPGAFRSFPTLRDGAVDYLRFLTRPAYADPWACVVAGDAEGFARALKSKGYYTAPVEQYVSGLRSLAAEFRHAAPEVHARDTDPVPPPVPVEVPQAVDFVATLADD